MPGARNFLSGIGLKKNVDYDYLSSKVKELQKEINKENLNIKIHLSAEVFYLPNLVKISKNPLITIGNGKYMLIEFTTNIFPEGYEEEFFRLQSIGITPIVAHPERYRFIHKDINILNDWMYRDYVIQIDAGSIIGQFGKKTKNISIQMIKSGYVHIIGSDAHNQFKRNFCITDAYNICKKLNGIRFVNFLKKNTFNIIKGNKSLRGYYHR